MRIPFAFMKPSGGAPSWSPLDDVGTISLLMLPGGYSITGIKGVNAVGTWTDESGNGNDAVQSVDANVPVPHASAWPVFVAASTEFLDIATSFDGDTFPMASITTCANGGIVIVGKSTVLAAYAPNYTNAAFISGDGASPGIYLDDAGGRITSYTDAALYEDQIMAGGAADTPVLVAGKWDAVGLYASVGGAPWSAVFPYTAGAGLSQGNLGPTTRVGRSYAAYLGGDIRAIGVYPLASDLDNAKLAQWQAWAVAESLV